MYYIDDNGQFSTVVVVIHAQHINIIIAIILR